MSIGDFAEKYQEYKAHCTQQEDFNTSHPLHAEMLLSLTDLYKQRFPRRRFTFDKAKKDLPEYESIFQSFRDRAQWIYETWFTEKMRLEYDLAVMAEVITPKEIQEHCANCDYYEPVHVVSSYDFHTQGYGAAKYAEGEAMCWQHKFEHYGVPARINEVVSLDCFVHSRALRTYGVEAKCAPIVAEIIRRKPAIPLRDWLKLCWKNQVNPRVYNPFLRHGLEEELNLDYFGNDVDPERKEEEVV